MQKKHKNKYSCLAKESSKQLNSFLYKKTDFHFVNAESINNYQSFKQRAFLQSQRSTSRFNNINKISARKSQDILLASNSLIKNKPGIYKSHGNSPIREPLLTKNKIERNRNGRYTIKKNNVPFKLIYRIGFGGLGKVWKVQDNATKQNYAMKCMLKKKVIVKQSVDSIMKERIILSNIYHPFIINMHKAFQDQESLYLTMDYLRGGDLRYHLCYQQQFSQLQTKFIISCLIIALQYIHSMRIVHRDIKPQNIVFEQNGYLRVTDFGIAKMLYEPQQDRNAQPSGTPGYMAPEVIFKQGIDGPVNDFFSLGVVCYQLMMGQRPYIGKNRDQVKQKMLNNPIRLKKNDARKGWSIESIDFINRLLQQNPSKRMGANGIQQLKTHAWLTAIRWKRLSQKKVTAPFVPDVISESRDYLTEIEEYSKMEDQKLNENLKFSQVQLTEYQYCFATYDYEKSNKDNSPWFQIDQPFVLTPTSTFLSSTHKHSRNPTSILQTNNRDKENVKRSQHRITKKANRKSCENIFSYLGHS